MHSFQSMRNFFGFALTMLCLDQSLCAGPITIVDLGSLAGYPTTFPAGVNNSGQVVGTGASNNNDTGHAFLYSNGAIQDLNTLGEINSYATGINNSGQVSGYSVTPNANHAFLYSNGVMMDLGTLAGVGSSFGYAVNDQSQVVGQSDTGIPGGGPHAFLYSNGKMTDIGTLGGFSSIAFGINQSGQVVGQASTSAEQSVAFLYSGGVMTSLGTLDGSGYSIADSINNSGQVAGYSTVTGKEVDAFIYANGVMTDIGAELPASVATSINDSGQTVGIAYSNQDESVNYAFPFLYSGGVLTNLNNLLPSGSGWILNTAYSISDSGNIVGYGTLDGQFQAYLLDLGETSTPEPGSGIACGVGLATLGLTLAAKAKFRRRGFKIKSR